MLQLWVLLLYLNLHAILGHAIRLPSTGLDFGTAQPDQPFWLESIQHRGSSPYNPDPMYQVFRNVKDFGAKGDGVTDDTAAINLAISFGNRCGGDNVTCDSSTISPALVYFPKGKYSVSSPIKTYYYTQLIGDAKNLPTLLATENFEGLAVIDADPYKTEGGQWFSNTNNFFRSIRNFIIDTRRIPPERAQGTGIHWQVAQATSLVNIVFELSTSPGNAHQGIWMENGSGGFMGDLVFNGGNYAMWVGNQQFSVRNITINNANTAILHHWNWAWTFQDVTINDCNVGFDLLAGVSAVSLIDAEITNTPIAIRSAAANNTQPAGSLVIDNLHLKNVTTAVADGNNRSVLAGGNMVTVKSWGQGQVFSGCSPSGTFKQGELATTDKPSVLLDEKGRVFGRTHPQYIDYSLDQFISAKAHGARGDGKTDDTDALQYLLNTAAVGRKIVFLDAGIYIVTNTLLIPAGTRLVGEAWSVIAGKGKMFSDKTKPHAVVRVGKEWTRGVVEITDVVFTTVGPAPGAIVVEWNIKDPYHAQGAAGMWDSHIRLGGATGSELETSNCPAGATNTTTCLAAFLALHLTPESSAYLEGTWVWLADHQLDHDNSSMITLYSGRGILSESKGPVWLIGTAEHHVQYQYRLVNAQNHYMGLIQTESPYWQPVPAAPEPFPIDKAFKDPSFGKTDTSSWAVSIKASKDIIILGGGIYSFFNNYTQTCLETRDCQSKIVDISSDSFVSIYSLSTIASTFQISVDGNGIVNQSANINGMVSTLALWSSFVQSTNNSGQEVHVQIELSA